MHQQNLTILPKRLSQRAEVSLIADVPQSANLDASIKRPPLRQELHISYDLR